MTTIDADRFAGEWIAAWNAHDLDAVLSHFEPDAEFTSPLVPTLTGTPNPVRGHDRMRAYWEEGLRRLPDLHFTLDTVYEGDGCLVISYRNERGRSAVEVLVLGPHGRPRRGWALYGPEP